MDFNENELAIMYKLLKAEKERIRVTKKPSDEIVDTYTTIIYLIQKFEKVDSIKKELWK